LAKQGELQILISYKGAPRRLCKLAFSNSDASIYLFAFAQHGKYFYGGRSLIEKQIQDTFDYTKQLESNAVPKLSIHQSGRVHAKVEGKSIKPLWIPPLTALRGQHVATVCAESFTELPLFERDIQDSAREICFINFDKGAESGRLAIYINGTESRFVSKRCRLGISLQPPRTLVPLHIGLAPIAQSPLGTDEKAGVTVIAGWDPTRPMNAAQDYLYIRGA
jgi:hypothetical protein